MFPEIRTIADVQPFVADKKEIRFMEQPNGTTVGCYMFMDGHTFDTPQALECRGIAFDSAGKIVSRPLHKFFNVGEKAWLMPEELLARNDLAQVQEKLDGSLIATAWIDGELHWRSRKSFTSDVVRLAEDMLTQPEWSNAADFASEVAWRGMTACFELTHPQAQIVVSPDRPRLRLLHVRDNVTGAYVLLNPDHEIHRLIADYAVARVESHDFDMPAVMASLEAMKDREGYVCQFGTGDMVKIKCPWYARLHKSITFLRERSIAELSLHEELDDVKLALREVGVDLGEVEAVESRLKERLTAIADEVEGIYLDGKDMDRKSYAIKNKAHPYFGMAMSRYLGKDPDIKDWYERHRLREDFGLRVLANGAQAEELLS